MAVADELAGAGARQDAAHHLVGRLTYGGHGGDAQALVDVGPPRVIDPGDDVVHAEALPGYPRSHDVGVVPVGHGDEGVGLVDARLLQGVAVVTDPLDLAAVEVRGQAAEGVRGAVDDGHRVPDTVELNSHGRSDAATAHDDEVHEEDGTPLSGRGRNIWRRA